MMCAAAARPVMSPPPARGSPPPDTDPPPRCSPFSSRARGSAGSQQLVTLPPPGPSHLEPVPSLVPAGLELCSEKWGDPDAPSWHAHSRPRWIPG